MLLFSLIWVKKYFLDTKKKNVIFHFFSEFWNIVKVSFFTIYFHLFRIMSSVLEYKCRPARRLGSKQAFGVSPVEGPPCCVPGMRACVQQTPPLAATGPALTRHSWHSADALWPPGPGQVTHSKTIKKSDIQPHEWQKSLRRRRSQRPTNLLLKGRSFNNHFISFYFAYFFFFYIYNNDSILYGF